MRGMPYNLQEQGSIVTEVKPKKVSSNSSESEPEPESEPTSVLDKRRSPSPTSTLSSSLGGSGSSDSGGAGGGGGAVAAVSGENGGKKEEWGSDLQPIPAGLEIDGSDKNGLGMEDWEGIIPETPASPTQDHPILTWIMGEMDDPSGLKIQQGAAGSVGGGGSDFEDTVNGDCVFGLVDPGVAGFGFSMDTPMSVGSGGGGGAGALGGISLSSSSFPRISNTTNNSINPSLPVKLPCFNGGVPNSIFPSSPNAPLQLPLPLLNSPAFFQQTQFDGGLKIESIDEKPHLFHHPPMQFMNPSQNQGCFFPFPQSQNHEHFFPTHPKRHPSLLEQQHQQFNQNWPNQPVKQECHGQIPVPKFPYSDSGHDIFLRKQQQHQQQQHQLQAAGNGIQSHFVLPQQHHLLPHMSPLHQRPKPKAGLSSDEAQQQTMVDQLFKAAEQIENGNSTLARTILARLNHQLSPIGKPLQRAAFYFMEALNLLLINISSPSQNPPHRTSLSSSRSPLDVVLKIGAYKVFSEVSPLLQFAHFTCNQALLETLDGFNLIHIIDFEIGLGGQWASFMQEIALKIGNSNPPSLKITAFTSPAVYDPLEISLTRENLTHFANDLNISFEFNVLHIESFDPSMLNSSDNHEFVAVNFPVGSHLSFNPVPIPSLLRLVKQISPKIVVSIDRGCDRSDLSFSHHFLNALHSHSILLDSLDAMNVNSDTLHKIERYLIKPRIETIVAGRHRAETIPPWRSLFMSAGFAPIPFSNFTETQAEWVAKRHQVRGFHVEKQLNSLLLCWQHRGELGELISVTAWRC